MSEITRERNKLLRQVESFLEWPMVILAFVRGGLEDYGAALWWTTMIITTLGSDFWPQTLEGRILCIVLSLFAFAVFGYITATIATFFIGRDAEENKDAGKTREMAELKREISELKTMIRTLGAS